MMKRVAVHKHFENTINVPSGTRSKYSPKRSHLKYGPSSGYNKYHSALYDLEKKVYIKLERLLSKEGEVKLPYEFYSEKDEFDCSLTIDPERFLQLSQEEKEEFLTKYHKIPSL